MAETHRHPGEHTRSHSLIRVGDLDLHRERAGSGIDRRINQVDFTLENLVSVHIQPDIYLMAFLHFRKKTLGDIHH